MYSKGMFNNMKSIIKIKENDRQFIVESPFLMAAHHKEIYPRANNQFGPDADLSNRNLGNDFSNIDGYSMYHGKTVPGFPVHPHRGFETVTITQEGLVDHFDSTGAKGRYGNGDVQWLTTGKGCQHSEMFPLLNKERENRAEIFQIWLNLPAKNKFANPYFKMFWSEDIPMIYLQDRKVEIKLITGQYNNQNSIKPAPNSWAANPSNNVRIMVVTMEPNSEFKLDKVSSTLNRNIYFYDGEDDIKIDNQEIRANYRVKLDGNNDVSIVNGNSKVKILLLEGEPINEPVVQYGPFVMNTKAEIQQTIKEYQRTRFGGWKWDSNAPINGRQDGRFASISETETEYPQNKEA